MNKKILHIVTELFPPDETSTAYILGEMANAAAHEYDVHVICGPEIYDTRKKIDDKNPFKLDERIKLTRVQSLGVDKNTKLGKAWAFLTMSLKLYSIAKSKIKEGDKVLMVTNPAPLVLLISRLRKKRAFNLNILVHDVFPENTASAGLHLPSSVYKLLKRWYDRAYACADKLLALGRDMASILRQKTQSSIPIAIVENWADVDNVHPLPFPDGKIKLQYAGNIGRVQGLESLMENLPKDIELHFYGTGSIEKTLRAKGQTNVYFHGPYFRSQQTSVIGSAHVSVVTLDKGMYGLGVPSKTYNIMAAGRPVLYFGPEDGEIGLLIKEHKIGYIGWPREWDVNELATMGKKARLVAEQMYSKEFILDKFLKALR